MESVHWDGSGLRVRVAKAGPCLAVVSWQAGGKRQSVVKSVPTGIGVFDIPVFERPIAMSVDTMPMPDLGRFDTLYVHRPVENAAEIIQWFKAQGLPSLLTPDDMHVTIVFSKSPVFWNAAGETIDQIIVPTCVYDRVVTHLGPKAALVQKFESPYLWERWDLYRMIGASWDFPSYQPHISLTYEGADINPDRLIPWMGKIVLGPEVKGPVKADWSTKEE